MNFKVVEQTFNEYITAGLGLLLTLTESIARHENKM